MSLVHLNSVTNVHFSVVTERNNTLSQVPYPSGWLLTGSEPVPLSSLAAGCFTGLSNPRNRRSASTYSRPLQVCQIARHIPPLPTSNAVGLASYSRSQPTTDRPTDAVPTLALSPHSFPVGQQGKPLPSSSLCSLCGVQFPLDPSRLGPAVPAPRQGQPRFATSLPAPWQQDDTSIMADHNNNAHHETPTG